MTISGAVAMTSLVPIPRAQARTDARPSRSTRARPFRVQRTDGAVERGQIEKAHQRLDALHDVGDRTGLERVHDEDERDDQGERRRRRGETILQRRRQQRAPRDAEQQERGGQVNEEVGRVVPVERAARQRLVDGKGQRRHRPARQRGVRRRRHRRRQRPEAAQVLVLRDGRLVVEHEEAGEAVGVGGESGDQDQRRRQSVAKGERLPGVPDRAGALVTRTAERRLDLEPANGLERTHAIANERRAEFGHARLRATSAKLSASERAERVEGPKKSGGEMSRRPIQFTS